MNKTNSSWCSRSSKKPDGFRVLLKSRNNPNQKAQEPLQRNIVSALNQQQAWSNYRPENNPSNLKQMKNYVRNRMKTDYSDNYSVSRLSSSLNKKRQTNAVRESVQISRAKQSGAATPTSQSLLVRKPFQSNQNTPRKRYESQHQNVSLEVLQKKIVELLDKRISFCAQNTESKKRNDQLQNQLKQLVCTLRDLQKENPQTIETDIKHLDKKIKLFQRLMAQNMSELQIMKNYYLGKLTSRNKHQRIKTQMNVPTKKLDMSRYQQSSLRTPVVNSSLSKQNYQAPEKSAYKIYKYTNKFFNADRHKQPLPRSSYNREYLVNPPSVNERYKPKDTNVLGKTASDRFLDSSYQEQFKRKKVEKTNYRQLDAFKNKIKSLEVRYDRNMRKSSLSPNSYNVFLAKLTQEPHIKLQKKPLLITKPVLSQSRRQFKKTDHPHITSQIKHKNLHKMKYQYIHKTQI